ncbi:MAG: type I restriction endonuclease subunit R [Clostridia bacterium]|nr:type I restriction endonuclease subunit R [Clostridia bacterium]
MPNVDLREKRFEQDIEEYMITSGGLVRFSKQDEKGTWVYSQVFDRDKYLYVDVLSDFIKSTQPQAWARYEKLYGVQAKSKLAARFDKEVQDHGLIYVLRNGITDMGVKLKVCYFKPESELNEKDNELYKKNVVSVTRQFYFSATTHETIDMVISVNGIPVIALELKNQFTGQNYEDAIIQYKERDSKERIFRLNYRFLVYFAVDHYETWMTTVLKGEHTYFLPFNQGSNGAGNSGGKGNPSNPNGYSTSYLWEKVLTKDSILDVIRKFVSFVKEDKEIEVNGKTKEITEEKLLFPRYHQFDVVHKVINDIKENGAGKNYLIEHSAGSGKSNSIAWISYRLASLFDAENKPVFNSVIVVTNRVVLDSQLQETIIGFDHTPGLVEAIDGEKRSAGLVEAINNKKRIIICTVQKFLFAYKDFNDLTGRNFAVLIDEAHQGQNGKTALALKTGLLDKDKALKEYADEEGLEVEDLTEGDVLDSLISQGKHSNQTFIAFTATPKPKTLEAFGMIDESKPIIDGKPVFKPFHVYSMKQAIQEGFILDVLQDYMTIKEAFKIVKVTDENPELIEGPAQKALVRYYKEHGYTIGHKTEVIMSNFMQNGIKKINGHGKAMVVADSRHNAVRYFFAIRDYIKNHSAECHNVGVLVAFSGTVKFDDDPDNEYTEANLNIDYEGHSINTDKKFRKAIRSDRYQIMVVADKYQTGFDEPLLHSMYIDKKLAGVNAVQTLSRLNRTIRGKTDTFVLDFVNTEGEIKKAFSQFYEDTVLDGVTDYNQVYDIRAKINEFMLYNFDVIDEFYNIMSAQSGKKQTATTSGKLSSLLKPVVDGYMELEKDKQFTYRKLIKKFNKAYSFIAQLVRIHDEELFKEYLFTCHLISYLPFDKVDRYLLDDKIRLEFESLKESFRGAIHLEKYGEFKPGNSTDVPAPKKKKDTLERIIEKVNDKYSGDFTDSDRVIISGILNMFMNDTEVKKYQRYALSNNPEMFVNSLFPEKFMEIVAKCFLENNDTFRKLYEDSDFKEKVMQAMGKELYKELRKKTDD